MGVLYKVDTRKWTYAEHWRIQWPNLDGFVVAALAKLLGVPRRCTFGIRRPETLDMHEPSVVPCLVRERLANTIGACADLGLSFQFYATVDVMVGKRVQAYMAAMVCESGLLWATAMVVLQGGGGTERVGPVKFNCFSRLPDGAYVATSDHVWRLTPHPDDLAEFVVGAPPDVVLARHEQRIEEPGQTPVRVWPYELPQVLLSREQRHVDYQVKRGVYVPMTAKEVWRITNRQ
jgi:hypothetical protein